MRTPKATGPAGKAPRVTLRQSWQIDRETLEDVAAALVLAEWGGVGSPLPEDWSPAEMRRRISQAYRQHGSSVESAAVDELADARREYPRAELDALELLAHGLVRDAYDWA
jgi:hypothetical protein